MCSRVLWGGNSFRGCRKFMWNHTMFGIPCCGLLIAWHISHHYKVTEVFGNSINSILGIQRILACRNPSTHQPSAKHAHSSTCKWELRQLCGHPWEWSPSPGLKSQLWSFTTGSFSLPGSPLCTDAATQLVLLDCETRSPTTALGWRIQFCGLAKSWVWVITHRNQNRPGVSDLGIFSRHSCQTNY